MNREEKNALSRQRILEAAPADTPTPVESPAATAAPEPMVITAGSREELKNAMADAIGQFCPELTAEISGDWLAQPEMDVRNIYYEIAAATPELKYVVDMEIGGQADSLVCTFHYMPYKTGAFPEGFTGLEVGSIPELIAAAEENMGTESVPIRITNRELDPDGMNRALQQAGGGYILCMLNRDATSDRGSTGEFGFLRFGLTELDGTKYQWDPEQVWRLIG